METELYKLVLGDRFRWNENEYKINKFIGKMNKQEYNIAFCNVRRLSTQRNVDIHVTYIVEKIEDIKKRN